LVYLGSQDLVTNARGPIREWVPKTKH
jgi:hypothetical protein